MPLFNMKQRTIHFVIKRTLPVAFTLTLVVLVILHAYILPIKWRKTRWFGKEIVEKGIPADGEVLPESHTESIVTKKVISFTNVKKVKIKPARCNGCNKWEFREIIQPASDFCTRNKSEELLLFIIVMSKPQNRHHRQILREIYLKNPKTVKQIQMAFAFGKFTNESEEKHLEHEADRFGDILQFDFTDNYANSSYILLNSYKWLLNHCKRTLFTVKITDDVYLNIDGILQLLGNNVDLFQDVLFGYAWMNSARVTDPRNKYHTPSHIYPYLRYPPFVSGAAIFASTNLSRLILAEASNFAFEFYHDDVSIGMVLKLAGKCVCHLPGLQYAVRYETKRLFPSRKITKNTCSKLNGVILGVHLDGMLPEMLAEVAKCSSNFNVPNVKKEMCFLSKSCPRDKNFPLF